MKSIFYLWRTSLKNRLLNMKHHPGQLIFVILMAFLLIFCLISAALSPGVALPAGRSPDLTPLSAILGGVFLFLFVTSVQKGLSSGASFFTVADVNLLFLSPVSPQKILTYGLVKQAGTTLLLGFFILFQSSNLKSFFGLGTAAVFTLFLGYCLFSFLGELVSMIIYAGISGDPRRKTLVKNGLYALIALAAVLFVATTVQTGDILTALLRLLGSPDFQYIPLMGWTTGIIMRLITGDLAVALIFLALDVLLGAGIVFLVSRTGSDYYEDVLQSAENAYAMKTAAREGRVMETRDTAKISRKKTGIGRGKGASVFFYKHLLENRRSGTLGINKFTLIYAVAGWALCIFLGDKLDYMWILGMLCYLQLFSAVSGRWIKETALPYIYMIPQPSFKKLFFASLESLLDGLVGGVIILIPCGLILGEGPLIITAALITRLGLACLLSAGNILVQRLLGGLQSKMLITLLYYLILIIVLIPGVIVAAITGVLTLSLPLALFTDAAVNIVLALILLFTCRNVIDIMELNL